ncbi:conserved hypothetical protein [Hoeflea sp. EC-HK425]|nr:conserved hypothetical protein [Hoeflea sp. EC-HK425]
MAPGDFDGPDLQRFFIDPKVELAPDAPFRAAMLACVPLAFTFDLDPGCRVALNWVLPQSLWLTEC